jgi:hypothetical protein
MSQNCPSASQSLSDHFSKEERIQFEVQAIMSIFNSVADIPVHLKDEAYYHFLRLQEELGT